MRVTVDVKNYNSKFQGMSGTALRLGNGLLTGKALEVLLDGWTRPLLFNLNELRNEDLTPRA